MALRYMRHMLRHWSQLTAEGGHAETVGALSSLASFLERAGRPAEAAGWSERALALNVRLVGEQHPVSAMLHEQLLRNLRARGLLRAALPHARAVQRFAQASVGPDHADTQEALAQLKELTAACVAEARRERA